MALPTTDCYDGQDPCCDHMFVIADNILEIAHTAVVGCMIGLDCLNPLEGYISVGQRINDPASDYLVVSLIQIYPTQGSDLGNGKMFIPLFRAEFQVRLLETGWPLAWNDDQEIIVPTAAEYSNAARFSFAHAQVMYKALANALVANELNPFCDAGCFKSISNLVPVEPTGGSVGWECIITVDADLLTPYS
jgi:hypothetical protein